MGSRAAAWLSWALVALSVALIVGGFSLSQAVSTADSGLQVGGETDDSSVVTDLVTLLVFSAVGAIIASRQPRNAIGWIFCGVGLAMGINSLAGGYAEYRLSGGYGPWSLAETAAWLWRPVAWCAAIGLIGFLAGYTLEAGPLDDFPQILNPYGVDSLILDAVAVTGAILASASMVASVVSLLVRMRRAGRAQRQQIKWLAYGGAIVVGAVFASGVISIWSGNVGIAVSSVGLLGVPIFTGVAIARYRLYEIDIVINRTLVYGALTAALVALYFGGVATLQALLRALSGQEQQPQLAILVSTLAIAALFDPLRRRIQSFIDRRFYRSKYDARKTLEAFSLKLRDETDLDALSDDLVGVVRETLQPAHVAVWLRANTLPKGEQAQ